MQALVDRSFISLVPAGPLWRPVENSLILLCLLSVSNPLALGFETVRSVEIVNYPKISFKLLFVPLLLPSHSHIQKHEVLFVRFHRTHFGAAEMECVATTMYPKRSALCTKRSFV